MSNDHRQSFIRLFNDTARNHRRFDVFRDFVTIASYSLHNAVFMNQEFEDDYLSIIKHYKKDDVTKLCHLLAELTMGLEAHTCDFLGSVFMELELGSRHTGQFFTPYEVAKLMAVLTHGDSISNSADKPFITLSEPACGAGGMVIAFAEAMLESNVNPQKKLWVSCWDLDPVAAMMCYLQLSLLHIPAEVVTGNTLSLESSRIMRTPAHYLGFWDSKLKTHWKSDVKETVLAPTDEKQVIIPVASMKQAESSQLSLFDFTA